MMNKLKILMCVVPLTFTMTVMAQMENSIKLNEVVTANEGGLQDEYGQRGAWVEIANTSHSTYDIRGMFVTTDRAVLDKSMSAPDRMKHMSAIPSGDGRTNLSARQLLVFYLNSSPARGSLHLNVPINKEKPTWIALYNGNGVDLVDSVTVPVLAKNCSFARTDDGTWEVKRPETVTPWIMNTVEQGESKVAKVKRTDPYGIGITVLSMGIVFFCLALLYAFFAIFGSYMRRREEARSTVNAQPVKANSQPQSVPVPEATDREVYMAVIAMALKQYQDDVHDVESGIITIRPKHTEWNAELMLMTQFHE